MKLLKFAILQPVQYKQLLSNVNVPYSFVTPEVVDFFMEGKYSSGMMGRLCHAMLALQEVKDDHGSECED